MTSDEHRRGAHLRLPATRACCRPKCFLRNSGAGGDRAIGNRPVAASAHARPTSPDSVPSADTGILPARCFDGAWGLAPTRGSEARVRGFIPGGETRRDAGGDAGETAGLDERSASLDAPVAPTAQAHEAPQTAIPGDPDSVLQAHPSAHRRRLHRRRTVRIVPDVSHDTR